jgi:hypothetical protein
MKKVVGRHAPKRPYRSLKHENNRDFPKKCSKCGGRSIRRSGYCDLKGKPMYYKKFLCKSCGRTMMRLSGLLYNQEGAYQKVSPLAANGDGHMD